MRMKRAGLLAAAITFARSEKGQQLIREARQKYDTPANRDKIRSAVSRRQSRPR